MPLTATPASMSGKTRVLGGITVIDTPPISRAMEYVPIHSEPYRRFTDSVCGIVQAKPETTYDNFAGDFGQRLSPGTSVRPRWIS